MLETLRPTSSWEGPASGQGIFLGGRGFGLAMETLISYLGSEHGNTYALGLITFIFFFYFRIAYVLLLAQPKYILNEMTIFFPLLT